MREIKFRVWLKNKEEMVDVNNIDFENEEISYPLYSAFCVDENGNSMINGVAKFENIELMQYTGLKDKNGKEIYEGDVIKDRSSNILYKVVYQFGIFNVERNAGTYIERVSLNTWCNSFINEIQVVGNIYENKDLLEE